MGILTTLISFFFFNDTATTEIYTLSLHDALPICSVVRQLEAPRLAVVRAGERSLFVTEQLRLEQRVGQRRAVDRLQPRSEEHTSELQSQSNLVCRLLLEKKNHKRRISPSLDTRTT